MFIKALKSRTVWTVVLMFLVGGVQNVSSLIPASIDHWLLLVLGGLATYFHLNPSQDYSSPTV